MMSQVVHLGKGSRLKTAAVETKVQGLVNRSPMSAHALWTRASLAGSHLGILTSCVLEWPLP